MFLWLPQIDIMLRKSAYIFFITLLFAGIYLPVKEVRAQNVDQQWAVKPSYSFQIYTGELNNQLLNTDNMNHGGGFSFSKYLNSSIDLLLGVDYYQLKMDNTFEEDNYHNSGYLVTPNFTFNYKFYNNYILPEDALFKPYIGFGFNYLTGQSKGTSYDLSGDDYEHFIDEVALNFSPGVKYNISRRIALFAELSILLATTDEIDGASFNRENDHFTGGRVGMYFNISGIKDQDKDGVPDIDDECPDTPRGVKVDEDGCPQDRDKDGIPDYLDDCPDDPGLPEYNGCPDTDGDGIIDKEDDCPELPGVPEYNGCPDTDGDGVIDPDDLCPGTQAGITVDQYGCPIDSDGDGLTDDVDQCPDEYGPMEYLGCPEPPDVGWPSMEQETPPEVYFETDKYELDPEAEAELDKIIDYLFENPMMNIRLYGFADPRGTDEYNDVLSARRVEAVKKYLMRKGVPENRIMVKALGEIQEVQSVEGDENATIDQKFRKARKVQFETFFFMR